MGRASFLFPGRVRVVISGSRSTVAHFVREYAPCRVEASDEPDVEIAVVTRPAYVRRDTGGPAHADGHKSVGWTVSFGPADDVPLRATITLYGWPSSIARSLVQGYLVEPLISVAAVRRGLVLVPAAALETDAGLTVLLGRSRVGKSTLAARAMASGRRVLADDQVFVAPDGSCWGLPRRPRFYPDIAQTAPAAYRRLSRRTRGLLAARRSLALATRGYVRPSLAIDSGELGGSWIGEALRFGAVILIERSPGVVEIERSPADAAAAVEWATLLLDEQRARLHRAGDDEWRASLVRVADLEREILGRAFGEAWVELVRIPGTWSAADAIPAVAARLGIEK
jgi:hypothetical protein